MTDAADTDAACAACLVDTYTFVFVYLCNCVFVCLCICVFVCLCICKCLLQHDAASLMLSAPPVCLVQILPLAAFHLDFSDTEGAHAYFIVSI